MPPTCSTPPQVDVWEELKRIHGTAPFMFGPTAATDVFIEASGADAVIGDVLQNGRVDGRLVIVALHYRPVPTNYVNLLMKQFTDPRLDGVPASASRTPSSCSTAATSPVSSPTRCRSRSSATGSRCSRARRTAGRS